MNETAQEFPSRFNFLVSEFKLQLPLIIHFMTINQEKKVWIPVTNQAMSKLAPLFFFHKDDVGVKYIYLLKRLLSIVSET